jgi:hypothetical protein
MAAAERWQVHFAVDGASLAVENGDGSHVPDRLRFFMPPTHRRSIACPCIGGRSRRSTAADQSITGLKIAISVARERTRIHVLRKKPGHFARHECLPHRPDTNGSRAMGRTSTITDDDALCRRMSSARSDG